MIASENLPLSIVDSKAFKRLMNTAAPLYTVPSRRTITRLIDAKYDVLKEIVYLAISKIAVIRFDLF